MPDETSDQILIERSRDGDTEAFRELFDRKHRFVYLIAYQILGDAALAEDVAQEVFIRLWEHCAAYDQRYSVDAWLRRIATNRSIDYWRSRRTERKHRPEPAGASSYLMPPDGTETAPALRTGSDPEARYEWRQLQEIWDDLARDLPPQQRAAFVLRHIEGVPTAEVAKALGCGASTVRSHVAEARSTLRKALRARYPELLDAS